MTVNSGFTGGLPTFFILNSLIAIVMFVVAIYALVMFIKLAHRGIKALDYYNEKAELERANRKEKDNIL